MRWLAGVVIVLGGLLNMGVFLRVGGEFLVVCCGMNLRYLERRGFVEDLRIIRRTVALALHPGRRVRGPGRPADAGGKE